MGGIRDLAPEIQKRISDFEHFLCKEGLKRPEVKFTGAILASMLKVHHVQLATLARGLGEEISVKKTCERLNRHLAKEEFGTNLIKLLILSNQLPRKRLSDIPDYPYYMIIAAVARTLELAVK